MIPRAGRNFVLYDLIHPIVRHREPITPD